MKNLTQLDRKILFALDKDGNISFSDIAKAVDTSPQVVKYHYQRYLDEGIIKNFWAFVDYDKMGYPIFWGYWLKFTAISQDGEKELYTYLNDQADIPIVMRSDGYADVMIAVIAKDVFAHNHILQTFLNKFPQSVSVLDMVIGTGFVKFPRSYLVGTENTERDLKISGGPTKPARLGSIDRKLISILQTKGRMKLSDAAELLGVSRSLVYKRYDLLVKKEVITKTTFTLNHKEIGIELYRNLFKISEFNQKQTAEFYQYCVQHPNINNYVKTMGQWQVMIDFEVDNRAQLRSILQEIKYKFKETVQEIVINEIYQIDKFSQMKIEHPELLP